MRYRILVGASLLAVASLSLGWFAAGSSSAADDLGDMNKEELESEKLREEIRELRNSQGARGLIADFAPLGTLLVGFIGAGVAYSRFSHDRKAESIRRMDERFGHVAADLGSDSEVVRSGAAVALRTFLKPRYREELLDDAFGLVVTNVKIADHPKGVRRLLVEALQEGVKQRLDAGQSMEGVSLARAWLERFHVEDVDLQGMDLAWAKLRGANLRGCDLRNTRAIGVDVSKAVLSEANLHGVHWQETTAKGTYFHRTQMAAVDLKKSNLAGANFEDALLSSAHLQEADLRGANFSGSKVTDTHFEKATLDDSTFRSLLQAVGWRDAHFDPAADVRLRELDGQRSRPS